MTRQTTSDPAPEPASDPAESFWSFALTHYGRDGVADKLLALQDAHGRDVLLLLCAAWIARSGRMLSATDADHVARTHLHYSGDMVLPIRTLRRAARGLEQGGSAPGGLGPEELGPEGLGPDGTFAGADDLVDDLYRKLKAAELAAERLGCDRLARLAASRWSIPSAPPGDDAPRDGAPRDGDHIQRALTLMDLLLGAAASDDEASLRTAVV